MDDGVLPPGTKVGDFVIEARIGEGGMGAVYSAVHATIGKKAAIKIIRADLCTPAARERFVQEARVVNQIDHPNIVDVFAIGELEDKRPYLVMELLRGETLAGRMDASRAIPLDSIEILLQIAAALTAAHARGVVHRDLKPENIFLAYKDGEAAVKLLDFGIAKLMDGPAGTLTLTRTGIMVGTPEYVSPEQARGRNVDHRTDIYSLGVIAYEMFVEDVPFTGDNAADVIAMHLHEQPEPLRMLWPEVPPKLERLVLEMLAKEAGRRPSLETIIATLEVVRDEIAERAGTAARTPRLRARSRVAQGSDAPALRASEFMRLRNLDTMSIAAPPVVRRRQSRRRLLIGSVAAAVTVAGVALLLLWPDGSATSERPATSEPPTTSEHAAPALPDTLAPAATETATAPPTAVAPTAATTPTAAAAGAEVPPATTASERGGTGRTGPRSSRTGRAKDPKTPAAVDTKEATTTTPPTPPDERQFDPDGTMDAFGRQKK